MTGLLFMSSLLREPHTQRRLWSALVSSVIAFWCLVACTTKPTQHTKQALSTAPTPPQSSPLLGMLHRLSRTGQRKSCAALLDTLAPYITSRTTKGQEEIRLLVDYKGPADDLAAFHPETRAGSIYVLWSSVARLDDLLSLPGLREVGFSRKLNSHLNVSAALVQAPQTRFEYGVDGRRVMIGVIDTGIDFTHPSFQHPDGSTRILTILDFSQRASTQKPPPRVWTADEINQTLQGKGIVQHTDSTGHGTHVAGIAAGNGQTWPLTTPQSPQYVGMAPRADLVIVKALRAGSQEFDSGDILQGVQFVYQTARFLNRPFVINLSLGGHHGGHDGSTLLERALAAYSGPGKKGQIIVASAGNEGSDQIHASGWFTKTEQPLKLPLEIPDYKPGPKGNKASLWVEVWFPQEAEVTLSVKPPKGTQTPYYGPKQLMQSPLNTAHGRIIIVYQKRTTAPAGQSFSLLLSNDGNTALESGQWQLYLRGEASRFDAWIADSSLPEGSPLARWRDHLTQEALIGVPAASPALITVGSFNSRSGWLNPQGDVIQHTHAVGDISSFSSPGPTRDGRTKPEVIAPGLYIAAPSTTGSDPQANKRLAQGAFEVAQGTSQAVPHLAGGVALLLQVHPDLDTPTLRQHLLRNTSTDSFTGGGGVYQGKWGFGKLNLLSTLDSLQAQDNATPKVSATRSTLGAVFSWLPADGKSQTQIILIPKDDKGRAILGSINISMQTTAGTLATPIRRAPGRYELTLTASKEPGQAIISASAGGQSLEAKAEVAFVPPSNAEGGCQCAATPKQQPPASGWLLLWCVLGIWLIRKRNPRPELVRTDR